jgi:hypothetical protein
MTNATITPAVDMLRDQARAPSSVRRNTTTPNSGAWCCRTLRWCSGAHRVGKIEASLPLGARNDQVFGTWLGHSEDELDVYRAQGVIL